MTMKSSTAGIDVKIFREHDPRYRLIANNASKSQIPESTIKIDMLLAVKMLFFPPLLHS